MVIFVINTMSKKKFDYEQFREEALEALKSGKKLEGSDGVLAPLLKDLLDASLEGEMDAHQASTPGNRRNGKGSKRVRSSFGEVELNPPRDRDGSFEPELVPKRSRSLGEGIDEKVLSLYANGFGYRDIRKHLRELYGMEVSEATLSGITDRVIPLIHEWQSRPLDSMYAYVWMDAIHFKVRVDGQVQSRAVYCVLGVNQEGIKDVLGMYVGQSEGARFWLQVLEDLKNRGVGDILIACIDNLSGFADAVEMVFPRTEVQLCVIHQVRNSLKYVPWSNYKEFRTDLGKVYRAAGLAQAEHEFELFSQKWGEKYPPVIRSWERNWDRLTQYFKYPHEVRRVIYTTNIVEGYHRQLRKVTKTKGAFPSEMALQKLIFLAYREIKKKWARPVREWPKTLMKLHEFFPGRINLDL